MKIRVLYQENIKQRDGRLYPVYTTIEVPDGDYTITLDLDYKQRLDEAKPEKRNEVKRCETLQEMFDILNHKEFNACRRFFRHDGVSKAQVREDHNEECIHDADTTWREPLMKEVWDDRAFKKDEIERDMRWDYEDICDWVRKILVKKPKWAAAFIAVRLGGMSVNDYAASIGVKDASVVSKWLARAEKKLRENY